MSGLWHQVMRTMSQPGASPDDDILALAAADIALRNHPEPPADADVVLGIARSEFAAVLTVRQARIALQRAREMAREHARDQRRTDAGRAPEDPPDRA
ncbi:hypothetical protein SSPS47_01825 [Streptomyces sp. S4.7]|uniref:hypothetical protein n=1 Tax=Streptomyces sp. S4.7 TaxID=2705439 RepID=UPI0013985A22|nr:hypothetical protein [Streptomyces sp. S4.7]QHY93864.1 hypothetical protein SSPS47_01825 [Streptomyces sp. S4.7]